MKEKVSPILAGVVLVVLVLFIVGAYWWFIVRQEAGLPGAGEPAQQPPAPLGMGAQPQSGFAPRSR